MHTLADLFTDDRGTEDDTVRRVDPADERRRMTALVGPPRVERRPAGSRDDTPELIALVDSAARTATPALIAGGSGVPKLPRRGHKRTDWLNVSFAVLAVAFVGVVATFGGIQLANASPAASALRALSVDEASLANGEQALSSAAGRIGTVVTEARADADTIDPALAAVASYTDEAARAAAVQAVADYRAGLDAVVVPTPPAPYSRPNIDTDDLAEVGAQIDAVREQSDQLVGLTDQVRAVRDQVNALRDAFRASIATFGSTFPATAEAEIEEYIQADQSFIDAVRNAANAVPAAQAGGGLGAAEMVAYPPLVDALRLDHERVIDEILTAEARAREAARNSNSGGGGYVQPSDPIVEEPVAPEPEPEPTTPEPAEPTDPTIPVDPDNPGAALPTDPES